MGLPGHADLRLQSVYRASAPGDLETFQKDCFSDQRGYSYHD